MPHRIARPSAPLMERYKGRPDKLAELKANAKAWERLKRMALEPSRFYGKDAT